MWSQIQFLIPTIAIVLGNPLSLENSDVNGRVIGGVATEPFAYPFICSLQRIIDGDLTNTRHTCGATILTNEWILTAAHCIYNGDLSTFALKCGKWDLSLPEDSEQIRVFDRAYGHENFTFENLNPWDVAVLHVDTPLEWTAQVQPTKLPLEPFDSNGEARLAGWGVYRQDPIVLPDLLQEADVPIISLEECEEMFGGGSGVHEYNICTGPLNGDLGACNGDSGGPLFEVFGDNDWIQIGITSWGRNPCGQYPSVWVGIVNFLDWIREHCEHCV